MSVLAQAAEQQKYKKGDRYKRYCSGLLILWLGINLVFYHLHHINFTS